MGAAKARGSFEVRKAAAISAAIEKEKMEAERKQQIAIARKAARSEKLASKDSEIVSAPKSPGRGLSRLLLAQALAATMTRTY